MSGSRFLAGDIVLIRFPFTDYSSFKLRPALVMSISEFNQAGGDVVLVAISSNIVRSAIYDVVIRQEDRGFEKTGLRKSSAIRCGKMFTFGKGEIVRKLGELPTNYMTQCKSLLSRLFGIRGSEVKTD